MNTTIKWLMAVIFATGLAACGGGGNGGDGESSTAATVDSENKDDMAKATQAGADRAVDSQAAPGARSSGGSDSPGVLPLLEDTFEQFTQDYQFRSTEPRNDVSVGICSSGSATYDTSGFSNDGTGTVTVTYNNCTYTYGNDTTTVDGTAEWTLTEGQGQTYDFTYVYDLTVTYNGETTTLTGTYSCSYSDTSYSCSYEDSFTEGGVSYTVSDVSVSGNASSGYDVSARVEHESYGYVDIEATGLVQCDGGGFQSGTITVTDSSGSQVLRVDFEGDCTRMTVTYEGSATLVTY